jgi:hypothetical protein
MLKFLLFEFFRFALGSLFGYLLATLVCIYG